jgi:hypothetical protein
MLLLKINGPGMAGGINERLSAPADGKNMRDAI